MSSKRGRPALPGAARKGESFSFRANDEDTLRIRRLSGELQETDSGVMREALGALERELRGVPGAMRRVLDLLEESCPRTAQRVEQLLGRVRLAA